MSCLCRFGIVCIFRAPSVALIDGIENAQPSARDAAAPETAERAEPCAAPEAPLMAAILLPLCYDFPMPIIDDYAGIAAELRRIQAKRVPQEPPKRPRPANTGGGVVQVDIRPDPPLRRMPVLARRSWTTD
jgi:hypothetical protein